MQTSCKVVRFRSSGMRQCVRGQVVSNVLKDHSPFSFKNEAGQEKQLLFPECLKLEGESSTFLWNVKNKTPKDTVWHQRRLKTSHTHTHHIHFGIIHVTQFSDIRKRWTVLLATPLHLVHVQAVQIIVPHVTAATAKHKNLQHTIFSVPCYTIITVSTCVSQTETTHFQMNALQSHFIHSTSSQYESHLGIYPARSLADVML